MIENPKKYKAVETTHIYLTKMRHDKLIRVAKLKNTSKSKIVSELIDTIEEANKDECSDT